MISKIKLFKKNNGQVAIIVLIASAIILTLGLSASKQTVIDTKINVDEELLKEAFNAAESGINSYLNNGVTTYTSTGGDAATVQSSPIGNTVSISSEGQVLSTDNQFFWLVNHNSDGSIGTTFYTGDSVSLTAASDFSGALKVDYFYVESGVYKVKRFGCNYNSSTTVTGFDSSITNCSTIATNGVNPLLIVVTPIGAATPLTISGSSAFPLQGEELTSVGTVGSGVKTQVKTRSVYQVPSFFLDSLTAVGNIE